MTNFIEKDYMLFLERLKIEIDQLSRDTFNLIRNMKSEDNLEKYNEIRYALAKLSVKMEEFENLQRFEIEKLSLKD